MSDQKNLMHLINKQSFKMHLHSLRKNEYVKQLIHQSNNDFKKIEDSDKPKTEKRDLLSKYISKFKERLNDSEHSLFLNTQSLK